MRASIVFVGVSLGLGLGLAACGGGDEYCGNGKVEGDEQCDDGNTDETDYCRACVVYLPPRTTVKWVFDADAAPGFGQDGCSDLGVSRVEVALDGPTPATLDEACSVRQVVFENLEPGPYVASVTPVDTNGDSLVTAPVTQQVTARTTDTETTVDVPWDAWTGPYTGSFYFTIRWGGMDCADAAPAVATQEVTLTVGGNVVTQVSTTGQHLDGTPETCVPASNPSPISTLSVPFGPATILIVGRDVGGTEAFRGSFDTFVGAGAANPTIDYDVPTVYDAGPPDAI